MRVGASGQGVAMLQPNEVVNLVLAVALTPMFVVAVEGSELPEVTWLYAAYGAMMCAFVLTIAEGFWAPELLNLLEHIALAVAGGLAVRYMLILRTAGGRGA